jgi:serine/threonine-protein kinase
VKYCDACHSAYPDDFAICPRDQGPLRHASELLPGMVIRGKYEILDKIGSGGMASVYRARHQAFGEVCAIKVVAGKLAHDETFLKRFRNEAVVTRRLHHPHAVRVEDFDTTEDGRPFIVMEFVDGRNLRDVIRQEAPLHPRRAVEITRQVASALAAAHALGTVHRDIKPDNILLAVSADGRDFAKVLDFGIAKVRETVLGEEAYTPTRTGMVVGTPQYVSPEQAMGKRGEEIDGRSDLYSLGVVLYEMLTGRLPFVSDTAMGMILHHLQTAPTPPNVARPDLGIPAPLSDLLMIALQKEPGDRFPSAHDMAAALDIVENELPPLPDEEAPVNATSTPMRTPTPPAAAPSTPRPAAALPARATPPSVTPPPRTPPAHQRPTPQPAPTRVEDIAERPTRVFEGGAVTAVGTPTMAGGPARTPMPVPPLPPPRTPAPPGTRPRRMRQVLMWSGVAFLLLMIFGARDRRRAENTGPGEADPQAEASAEAGVPDDDALQQGIERLLHGARATREHEIDVEVEEGVVTLSGDVRDPAAAQVAEALAESYPGVKSVRNQIALPGAKEAEKAAEAAEKADPESRKVVIPVPPIPPVIAGEPPAPGTPQAQALADLLREGREALQKDRIEDAMALYSVAISLDNRNREARQGLQEATRRMRLKARQFQFRWVPPSTWPFTGEHPGPQPQARPSPVPRPAKPAPPSTPSPQ